MLSFRTIFIYESAERTDVLIELKHVTKSFRTDTGDIDAVNDVTLTIEKGDIYGIIGLSGAGKSTLVRCINFLEVPTSGEVVFKGTPLSSLSKKELLRTRRSISMIFQGFNLLSQRNALGNVCYPLEIAGVSKKEAIKKAKELLTVVGLEDRMNSYPAQLSGGQKQRVAIARALATDPEVLLCDEATSALDPNTTRSILELLKKINETMGVTIVVITHEMKVVEQICNKVAVLDHGVVAEEGLVKDIFIAPQSDIAKELILPKTSAVSKVIGGKTIRIVFDGQESSEPVISNLSLECRTAVNIMGADTKDIDGRAYGQMLIQLPDDETAVARIYNFLDKRNIKYEEVG
ncbi:MAG: ATP-binding cassette domain-containing protein [Ruminococcaceae bacterium]|nr:ATP-binding cassette domain-containing protein [Oscillospiraceae bacterium]